MPASPSQIRAALAQMLGAIHDPSTGMDPANQMSSGPGGAGYGQGGDPPNALANPPPMLQSAQQPQPTQAPPQQAQPQPQQQADPVTLARLRKLLEDLMKAREVVPRGSPDAQVIEEQIMTAQQTIAQMLGGQYRPLAQQ